MDKNDNLYNERLELFITTVNHQEPSRVPIMSMIETFAVAYANSTINECLESPQKEFEVFSKVYKDFYYDGAAYFGLTRSMAVFKALGNNAYFISEDGCTLQHGENCPMTAEDYDDFISDPMKWTDNVFLKRKYPNLNLPYPQNKEALKTAALAHANFGKKMAETPRYLKENLDMPLMAGRASSAPMDFIFDYYRGFTGTIIDLRRIPEKVKAATEALVDLSIKMATHGAPKLESYPWIFTPLHIPTYLGSKKFAEFYWPYYKKMLMAIYELGGKVFAMFEGNWENYYEYLQELPKNFVIGALEADDIVKAKKEIGNTITLVGGMLIDKLKYGTKSECIDYAKNIVDQCAPGGGYIFSTNVELLSGGDVNPENLKAVNKAIHVYR